jgi:ribonuclease HII
VARAASVSPPRPWGLRRGPHADQARVRDPRPPRLAIGCLAVEQALRGRGFRLIAGVDEAGRGCWAGPVFAAAVVLPPVCYDDRSLLAEVTDSKLLPAPKRERLAGDVQRLAAGAAIGWAEAPVVDRLNVLGATRLAMRAALACLAGAPPPSWLVAGPSWGAARLAGGRVVPDYVVVDAVHLPEVPLPQSAVVRGDQRCLAVAAASILAKVARDAEMRRRAAPFPEFGLADNKGYGTRRHLQALQRAGLTPLHRRTFAPMKYLLGVQDCVAGALPPPEAPA